MSRDLVDHYFTRAAAADLDAYVELFAPAVVVEDDGGTHVGPDAVRAWRAGVPPVTQEVTSVEETPSGWAALARVSGDFPGSPIDLRFRFVFDEAGRISRLAIAP